VETISIIVLLCHYKHNSRRSISKAAPCFGNLCVHEPSALRRKPSNLCCSCATNAFQKNVLNVGVLFLACIVSSSYSSIVFTDLCKEQLQDTIKLDFRNFFKLLTNLPFRSPLIESFHPCSMLFVFTFFALRHSRSYVVAWVGLSNCRYGWSWDRGHCFPVKQKCLD